MCRRRMMMSSKIDTTTDVLLHLNSSLINAVNNASPSGSFNTSLLAYAAAKFSNGITRTSGSSEDSPLVYEYDLPYNSLSANHDFSIDFWVNTLAGSSYSCGVGIGKAYTVMNKDSLSKGCDVFFKMGYSPQYILKPVIYRDGGDGAYDSYGTLTANAFNHVAICYNYNTNTMYVFINGTLTRTITSALVHALASTPKAIIGVADSDVIIDEVRVSNVVRWTANFTPPTAPYTI